MPSHILVIDDSKAVRLLIRKALAPFACVVTEATNGFKGLFAMERQLPDLLILDISMPTMDGLEMLTMLKSKPELAAIPVIMLSATTDHKILPRVLELAPDAILQKPFTEAAALESIRGVLKLQKKARA